MHYNPPMPANPLACIRVVLVSASHPGNIGAVARGMANMGLADLRLVAPARHPTAEATARAAGSPVLAEAVVHADLAEAIAPCSLVVAATARRRAARWPVMTPRSAAAALAAHAVGGGKSAVVFGPEQSGLSNADLDAAHALIHIPVNPDFASVNLAGAALLVAYELRLAVCGAGDAAVAPAQPPPATAEQVRGFHLHLLAVMRDSGFLRHKQPDALLRKIHLLFQRARLTAEEINILRGILSAVGGNKGGGRKPSP